MKHTRRILSVVFAVILILAPVNHVVASSMGNANTHSYTSGRCGTLGLEQLPDGMSIQDLKNSLVATGLCAVGSGKNKVTLAWDPVAGAEGYIIYCQRSNTGGYSYIGMTTNSTTYTDNSALDNDYNFYRVYPFVVYGGQRVLGYCPNYVYAKGVTAAVTGLSARAAGKGVVQISWDASPGAAGYLVYGKRGSDGVYGYITMTTGATTAKDTKAPSDIYSFYWVIPYHLDADGKRVYGPVSKNYVYAKGVVEAIMKPGLKAEGIPGGVKVSWNAVHGAEGYILYAKRPGESSFSYVTMTTKNLYCSDLVASIKDYTFYRVFPFHTEDGKRIIGASGDYVYCKAKGTVGNNIPATAIALTSEAVVVEVGGSLQLTASLTPVNSNSEITWKSWDETVFKVSSTGVITGLKSGSAYVSAVANGKSAKMLVRVEIPATAISLALSTEPNVPITEFTMLVGKKRQLKAILEPSGASPQVIWTSGNENLFSVDQYGNVTGISQGIDYVSAYASGLRTSVRVRVVAGGWMEEDGKLYYYDSQTGYMKKGSQTIDNKKYYFDLETGEMRTGFVTLNGSNGDFTCYYLPEGGIAEGFKDIDGDTYYFNPTSGVRAHGVREINQKKYYFDPQTGIMQTGFHTVELSNGTYTFYFLPDGGVAKDMQEIDGKTYYFGNDGALQKDKLIVSNGKRLYFTPDTGELANGVYKANNDYTYYFDPNTEDGVRHGFQEYEGETYLFHNVDGYALSRFQSQEANLYYFDENTYRLRKDATWQYAGIEFTADSQGTVQMQVLDTANQRSVILCWALSHLGISYGSDTDSLVCSSFVAEAYRQVGYTGLGEPRPAPYLGYTMESFEQAQYTLANGLVYDNIESIQPGDVIFWNQGNCADGASCEHRFEHGGVSYHIHHIGIYVGNGQVVEEAESIGWSLVQNILLPTDDFYIAFYADLLTQSSSANN